MLCAFCTNWWREKFKWKPSSESIFMVKLRDIQRNESRKVIKTFFFFVSEITRTQITRNVNEKKSGRRSDGALLFINISRALFHLVCHFAIPITILRYKYLYFDLWRCSNEKIIVSSFKCSQMISTELHRQHHHIEYAKIDDVLCEINRFKSHVRRRIFFAHFKFTFHVSLNIKGWVNPSKKIRMKIHAS